MTFLNKFLFIAAFILASNSLAQAQMPVGRDTLFGHEWIDYAKTYYRLDVAADGIYRLTNANLTTLGLPTNIAGNQFQIFRNGREIPIFTTTNSAFGSTDYLEFFGQRQRVELDSFLYPTGMKGLLNPEFNLITDTTAYFLTWSSTPSVKRYAVALNNLTNLPAPEASYQHVALNHAKKFVGDNTITKSSINPGVEVYLPEFVSGEGFGDFQLNTTVNNHELTGLIPNTPSKMYVRWSGNNIAHFTRLSLNGEVLTMDTIYNGNLREFSTDLTIAQTKNRMQLELKGLSSNNDRSSLAIFSIEHARSFIFNNQAIFNFKIAASSNVRYLEISTFKHDGVAPVLYDLTNNLRIVTQLENNLVKVALPPSVSDRQLILVSQTAIVAPPKMRVETLKDIRPDGGNYIIVANKRHLTDSKVRDYANYRASAAGGSYRPVIVDVDDIYAQFGYGTNRHPLALRNYFHYIKKNWADPKFILLMGKGREYRHSRDVEDVVKHGELDVPTWGYPASDILLAASHQNDEPIIPIGRIPITTTNDLQIYLDKVREHEADLANAPQSITARDWRKQVVHLSGGGPGELEQIKNNLLFIGKSLGNYKFGATVSTFYKTNFDPVQVSTNDQIFNRMNQGASVMTFFGHSGATVLDFEINSPEKMNNKGKYPVFIALGCAAANTFQRTQGLGETFTFQKDKGMLAFLGTSGFDFLHSLNQYANDMYRKIGETHYGKTIGEITKATIGTMKQNAGSDLKAVLQEWITNGDPALRFTRDTMTDYIPDPATVTFEPKVLNIQLDSFTVNFDVVNVGSTNQDSFNVVIRQQLPNGSILEASRLRMAPPKYRTTLSVNIPMPKSSMGQNRLLVRVDSDNQVAEMPAPAAEGNNDLALTSGQLGVPFFVLENSLRPVHPVEYAIVNKTPVTLVAQTSDPFAKTQTYIVQIDTTESFSSPLAQQTKVTRKGGILKWVPTINWRDSTVYYWRTTPDSISPQSSYVWQNSSFTFIRNSPSGWSQAHYQQFQDNQFKTLQLPDYSRKFDFSENVATISLKYDSLSPTLFPKYFRDGNEWGRTFTTVDPSLDGVFYVNVLDSIRSTTLLAKTRDLSQYGLPISGMTAYSPYIFRMSDTSSLTGRRGFINFIKQVPSNAYVLVYSVQTAASVSLSPQSMMQDSAMMGTTVVKILEEQGATQVRAYAARGVSTPYAFVFKKDKGALAEKAANRFEEGAGVDFSYVTRWFTGDMVSKPIGPAKSWSKFESVFQTQTTPKSDSVSFDIIGYSVSTGQDTVLMKEVKENVSLSTIDAAQYPYLRVRFAAYDNALRTAPQLNNWRVLYTGFPDFAISPDISFSFKNDSLLRGEQMSASIGVENINGEPTDSVDVMFIVRDEANSEKQFVKKYPPLSKEGSVTATWELNSKELKGGKYNFEMVVNPNGLEKEAVVFNNYWQKPFVVQKDTKNPLLDVTFDGLRIMNNDIVSAKPTIRIELKDENQYLLLQDTSLMQLFIMGPKTPKTRIFFNNPNLRFTPASNGGQNKASIEYKPTFKEDGIYQLSVNSQDASGNKTSDINYSINSDYTIAFKIYQKSSISNVLNYPNPFSTRTQFVYTLTGETTPQYFKIQIMTVSGKVVREITQDELGTMRIGTHRTDYAWDGTDEYGNKLANGVYLYRIIAKDASGKDIEAYSEKDAIGELSSMFKKGIGKLVIMR